MSQLIPEQRLDKNGHLVTRHVRQDNNKTSASSIPAPTAGGSASPKRKQQIDNMFDYICTMTEDDGFGSTMPFRIMHFDGYKEELENLDDSVLKTLDDIFTTGEDEEGMIELLMSSLCNGDRSRDLADILIATKYDKTRDPEWNEDMGVSHSYSHAADAVTGLERYEHLGFEAPDCISTSNEEDRAVCEALLQVKEAAERISYYEEGVLEYPAEGGVRLSDGMASLVLERPEQSDEICALMHQRNTGDAELVRSMLETENPVQNGVL